MTRQAYGSGSMTERGPGVWRLRVMVNGKQRQETFRGTEAAARKRLRNLAPGEEKAGVASPVGDGRTFGDLLTKWLAHIKTRGRAPKTIDENRREIESRIRPRLGHIAISKLTAEDLDSAYSAWLEELSPSSVHRHAAVISAALTQGVKWGWIDTSPATRASSPSATTTRKLVTPTTQQVATLIKAAQSDDPVMAAAIALAFVTGARRGELAALRWSDVDLHAGTVRIERSLTQVGRDLSEKSTKTNRGRIVAIDARTMALLERHRVWQVSLSKQAESPLVADAYLLSDNANGARPMQPSKITDRFTALREKVDMSSIRFHDLRHANVSEQLAAGIDPATVSARAGHASTRMTLDRYAHALPAGGTAAAEVLGALLPGE